VSSPNPAIRVSMLPRDTNAHGTIFGGTILSLIDQAGAIGAHQIGIGRVVTVSMREVEFKHPVEVGDIVSCYAEVTKVGRTSVTVRVRVTAHRPTDVEHGVDVTEAEVVYVHIDETGRPIPIAPKRL
jgi:acyl-CoA thioesterase YciA